MFEIVKRLIDEFYNFNLVFSVKELVENEEIVLNFEDIQEIFSDCLTEFVENIDIMDERVLSLSDYTAEDVYNYIDLKVNSEEFEQWYKNLLEEYS